jgi:hypothetical protein
LSKSSVCLDVTCNATVPLAEVGPPRSQRPLHVTVSCFGVAIAMSVPAGRASLSRPTQVPAPAEQLRNQRSLVFSRVGPVPTCEDE